MNIDSLFGHQKVPVTCPGCEHEFEVEFREVAVDGSVIACPSCKKEIAIEHTAETKESFENVEESLNDLERALRNFGK